MILVCIADIIHLTAEEKDAKPAYATLIPRQSGVRVFLLQGVEVYTAILETNRDAIVLMDDNIQKAIDTFRISV